MNRKELVQKLLNNNCKIIEEGKGHTLLDTTRVREVHLTLNGTGIRVHLGKTVEVYDNEVVLEKTVINNINNIEYVELI